MMQAFRQIILLIRDSTTLKINLHVDIHVYSHIIKFVFNIILCNSDHLNVMCVFALGFVPTDKWRAALLVTWHY